MGSVVCFGMPENKRAKFVAPFHRIAKKVWDIHVLVPSSRCSSLDFVSALLSACMGQRCNVLELFCWQKSRKMSWAPRWCFYKHIFWNFHPPIWGKMMKYCHFDENSDFQMGWCFSTPSRLSSIPHWLQHLSKTKIADWRGRTRIGRSAHSEKLQLEIVPKLPSL